MRALTMALTFIAATASPLLHAEGQAVYTDVDEAVQTGFWGSVYSNGGSDLLCQKPFSANDAGLEAAHIYSIKQIKSALRCLTDTQCAVKTPKYVFMAADLHNLYPITKEMETGRRNAAFAPIPEQGRKPNDLGCDARATYHVIEPAAHAKGNVARAILYMHVEYKLPLGMDLATLKQWNALDPVDDDEKLRNAKIAVLQGTRNRFIDDPRLVDQLTE